MRKPVQNRKIIIWSQGRFITEQDLAGILAGGPHNMQLYSVKGRIGNSRWRLDLTDGADNLMARVEHPNNAPIFQLCQVDQNTALRLINGAKSVTELGSV